MDTLGTTMFCSAPAIALIVHGKQEDSRTWRIYVLPSLDMQQHILPVVTVSAGGLR